MVTDKEKKTTGKIGEEAACKFLEERGHTILERNWRWRHLEVDIISMDGNGMHFVEVKARRSSVQAPPQESVTKAKQNRIAQAAARYMAGRGPEVEQMDCRFDIVSVVITAEEVQVEYFPEAWLPIFT